MCHLRSTAVIRILFGQGFQVKVSRCSLLKTFHVAPSWLGSKVFAPSSLVAPSLLGYCSLLAWKRQRETFERWLAPSTQTSRCCKKLHTRFHVAPSWLGLSRDCRLPRRAPTEIGEPGQCRFRAKREQLKTFRGLSPQSPGLEGQSRN